MGTDLVFWFRGGDNLKSEPGKSDEVYLTKQLVMSTLKSQDPFCIRTLNLPVSWEYSIVYGVYPPCRYWVSDSIVCEFTCGNGLKSHDIKTPNLL